MFERKGVKLLYHTRYTYGNELNCKNGLKSHKLLLTHFCMAYVHLILVGLCLSAYVYRVCILCFRASNEGKTGGKCQLKSIHNDTNILQFHYKDSKNMYLLMYTLVRHYIKLMLNYAQKILLTSHYYYLCRVLYIQSFIYL